MDYASLTDGVTVGADVLPKGLPVVAIHHPASAHRTAHYVVRLTLPHGIAYDVDQRPGTAALLALTFGTSMHARSKGRFTGADANVNYEAIDITLAGDDLDALLSELTARMTAPIPEGDDYENLTAALRSLAVRTALDPSALIANYAHRVYPKNSPYAWPWPIGSYYHTRPALVPMPPHALYARRHRRIGPRMSRLLIASTRGTTQALNTAMRSALAYWSERDGRFTAGHLTGWMPLQSVPRLTHRARHDIRLPDGNPGMHVLYTLPTTGGAASQCLDVLTKTPGLPVRLSYWEHSPATVLTLWDTVRADDTGGLVEHARRVTHFLGPFLRQDTAELNSIHLARRALDADIRARHRDPALLLPAYARLLMHHRGEDRLGTYSAEQMQRELATLTRGVAPGRFFALSSGDVAIRMDAIRDVVRRPVSRW